MVSKNEIKLIASLSQKKYRHQTELFVVEGEKMVAEALASSFAVERVFALADAAPVMKAALLSMASSDNHHMRGDIGVSLRSCEAAVAITRSQDCQNDNVHSSASAFAKAQSVEIEKVTEQQMKSMSALSSPSPALALVRIPQYDLTSIVDDAMQAGRLSLALDGVRDPGNLGTIMRIADWFGVDCVFASEDTVDLFNPKTVQATMGAIFRKTVVYTDISQLAARFRSAGRNVYGTFLDGNDIYRQQISAEGLVVMGSESFGISDVVRSHVSHRLYIPSYCSGPTSESLNVAVATAVTLAEFRRRENAS